MKKHLVALVLCLVMLLGCTAAMAEEEYLYYETTWFSEVELDFDAALETCRNSDRGVYRALVALFSCVEYNRKVENAYEPDFNQPIYVSAFSSDDAPCVLIVVFFSEDGHHVELLTDGNQTIYDVDTDTPSYTKSMQTLICDWTYEISSSDLLTVAEAINQN